MRGKFLLNESLFEDVEEEIEAVVEEQPSEEEKNNGIANLLMSAISDKWAMIGRLQDVTTNLLYQEEEDVAGLFEEIVRDEHRHIGMIQKALEQIQPAVEEIEAGQDEAEEKLEEVEEDEDE